uniref:Uncharacterized protein n=1 Tax=Spongospora subterranea TaxID=70186 RepID=A0A0H5QTN6_9EUKA|eukprot:CRZ05352.1 hypothetical protein [Spongospora subterranea]
MRNFGEALGKNDSLKLIVSVIQHKRFNTEESNSFVNSVNTNSLRAWVQQSRNVKAILVGPESVVSGNGTKFTNGPKSGMQKEFDSVMNPGTDSTLIMTLSIGSSCWYAIRTTAVMQIGVACASRKTSFPVIATPSDAALRPSTCPGT